MMSHIVCIQVEPLIIIKELTLFTQGNEYVTWEIYTSLNPIITELVGIDSKQAPGPLLTDPVGILPLVAAKQNDELLTIPRP